MKAVLKILGVILIGVGVIILIAGKSAASDALGLIILLLMGGIPAALGVLCLLKSKKKLDLAGSNVPEQPTVPPMPVPEPAPDIEPIQEPEPVIEQAAAPEPEKDPYKYYSFKVAGISFYEKDIIDTLAIENDDYDMTKKEIVDAYMTDEDIYKYIVQIDEIELDPEPDNPHDPNAIKVIADGVHIGYVPAKSTKKIRQLLEKHPEVMCNVYGGPSKIVFEESDGSYTMKKSDHNIGAEVILKYM